MHSFSSHSSVLASLIRVNGPDRQRSRLDRSVIVGAEGGLVMSTHKVIEDTRPVGLDAGKASPS